MQGRLTALQTRVLTLLAPIEPRWTLTGGGALVGFHLMHRVTRDLDLFWHGSSMLTDQSDQCSRRLEAAGLEVAVLQRAPGFVRLRASDGSEIVVIDLVAEPVPAVEAPLAVDVAGTSIRVDSRHEILVNKLGALLHRAELRDLVDLRELLAKGGELPRALRDAAKKDGGFSPLMVGHLLQSFPIERQGQLAAMPSSEIAALARFRSELAARVAELARP